MTNPRFSVNPPAGKPLDSRWKEMAPKRASMADAAYLHNLENAWKPSDGSGSTGNIMRDSRLKPPSWEDIIGQK
jgi:hypothetical protein